MSQGKSAFVLFLFCILMGIVYQIVNIGSVEAGTNNADKVTIYVDSVRGNVCYIAFGHRGISCVPDHR